MNYGTRFGSLTVLMRVSNTSRGNVRYSCKCDCGTQTITRASWLSSGKVTKCKACTKSQ